MFAKATTVFAIFAVAAQVVVATPPACLLAAVNECPDPADIKGICTKEASKVTSYLSKNCGEHEDAANKYFKEVCEDAGETISGGSSNSTSTASSTSRTASGTGSGSGSISTGSSSYNSTNSNSDHNSSPIVTGASSFATGISGAASGTGTDGIIATANGTLSTAGTAGPTTSGNADTSSPTGSAGDNESGVSSEGGAARMSTGVTTLAAIGVFGAMLAL